MMGKRLDCEPESEQQLRRNNRICESSIYLLFSVTVVPGLLYKLFGQARQQAANTNPELPAIAVAAQYSLTGLLLVVCLYGLVINYPNLLGRRSLSAVGLGLAVWAYSIVSTYLHGQSLSLFVIVLPFLLTSVWALKPDLGCLRAVGIAGSATAMLSLFLGITLPGIGLYVNDTGALAVSDKGFFSGNLLAGVFTSTNNLGQFVVLSLPLIALLRSPKLRLACLTVSLAAILWSGSRSSLFAILVMAFLWLLYRFTSARKQVYVVAVCVSAVFATVLPYLAQQNPDSFTGRGNLWRVSIAAWLNGPSLLGLGSRWYSELAGVRSGLGDRAAYISFHAHNQLLHEFVTLGFAGGTLFILWLVANLSPALRLEESELPAIGTWITVFFVSGSLELNVDMFDRVQFYGTALIPLLILGMGRVQPWTASASPAETVSIGVGRV